MILIYLWMHAYPLLEVEQLAQPSEGVDFYTGHSLTLPIV